MVFPSLIARPLLDGIALKPEPAHAPAQNRKHPREPRAQTNPRKMRAFTPQTALLRADSAGPPEEAGHQAWGTESGRRP